MMVKAVFILRSLLPERIGYFYLVLAIASWGLYFQAPLSYAASMNSLQQAGTAQELVLNAPIERQLKVGETHRYKISPSAGIYLRVLITPQDININSKLVAENSSADIGIAFYPGGHGAHFVSLIAETSGEYQLEIGLADNKAGRYEVKLVELRPATKEDKIRNAAEKSETEGIRLAPADTIVETRQAISKYEEALAHWRKLKDRKSELRLLGYLGTTNKQIGERQAALEYLSQAIVIAGELGNSYQEATMKMALAYIYSGRGEYQKALDLFHQARQIFKNSSKKYGEALAVSSIGTLLFELGEINNALPYFEESLPAFSLFGDAFGESRILNALGKSYTLLGNQQKGIEFYNRAIAAARKSESVMVEASTSGNLGNLYFQAGDKQKALDFFEQTLKLCRTSTDVICESDALKKIGDVAYFLGDQQKALDSLNQALQLYRSMWERDREIQTLYSLARVNYALGNFDEAKKQIEEALEFQELSRTKISSQQLREAFFVSVQDSFALYMDVLMQLHRKNPAVGYDALALQASERARARSLLDLLSESHANIRQGVPQDLLKLESTLQEQINAKAEARTRMLNDKRQAAQAGFFEKELTQLTRRLQQVKAQIRQSSPNYAALVQSQPLTAKEIQQQLDGNTLLLEFALGEKQSWLWAVTDAQIASFQLPGRDQIQMSARQVYELLTARQPKPDEAKILYQSRVAEADAKLPNQIAALSQMLFGQIAVQLQGGWKGKRLVIVAPEALEYIPFAVLPIPNGQQQDKSSLASNSQPLSLITQYEIVNLPSASSLAALRRETNGRKPAEKQVAVLADPVFTPTDSRLLNALKKPASQDVVANVRSANETAADVPAPAGQTPETINLGLMRSIEDVFSDKAREGFSRLPFSREEAEAIASFAAKNSSMKAVDFQANRATATNGELSHYQIVHFATHGLLNSQHPELSGLVLSLVDENGKSQDGFLRMQEIYNLNLPAELVVLSACQTGLGKEIKGEGLVGLTRGFMYAGAQRVVASLWKVDDFATAQLMKSFYRGMLKDGLKPAAALRAAQLEMLKQKSWSSPFFWAAFTIQGEWK
jgi:CHAT domain-containing protein